MNARYYQTQGCTIFMCNEHLQVPKVHWIVDLQASIPHFEYIADLRVKIYKTNIRTGEALEELTNAAEEVANPSIHLVSFEWLLLLSLFQKWKRELCSIERNKEKIEELMIKIHLKDLGSVLLVVWRHYTIVFIDRC